MGTMARERGAARVRIRPTSAEHLGFTVRAVFEDDSELDMPVASRNVRGAQREITSRMVVEGYDARGRWRNEGGEGASAVWSRVFAPVQGGGLPGRARRIVPAGRSARRVSPRASS